jgi:hypothetical protein
LRRKIADIRRNKRICDFEEWKGPDYARACLDWDDCLNCGAYTPKKEEVK